MRRITRADLLKLLAFVRRYPELFIIVVAFLLPFQKFGDAGVNLTPILTGVWGILWILDGLTGFRKFRWRPNPGMLWMSVFFAVTLAGLLWTGDMDTGLGRVRVRLGLFAIPLFMVWKPLSPLTGRRMLNAFLAGNVLSSLYCLIVGITESLSGNGFAMYYTQFSLFAHPSYFSLFIIISLAALIVRDDLPFRSPLPRMILIVYFMVVLYFLSSRAGLLSGAIVLVAAAALRPSASLRKARYWIAAMLAMLFVASWLMNYRSAPATMDAHVPTGRSEVADPDLPQSQSNSLRVMVWRSAVERIVPAWLTGYGTGDGQAELQEEYRERGYEVPLAKSLNAHNQYLETLLETGLPGLLALLAMLLLIGWDAWRKDNALVLAILALFALNFLFESVLNTQAGTVSFALFLAMSGAFNQRSPHHKAIP